VILAIDIGLSTVKTALFHPDGACAALDERPNCATRGTETDLEQLWQLVLTSLGAIRPSTGFADAIAGIGLSGHGNGVCLVTATGQPLHGVTSLDQRAAPVVADWTRSGLAERLFTVTGNHLWAGQPLPVLARLQHAGELPAGARVLFCKDWIRYKLTGQFVTDRGEASAAGLIDWRRGDWAAELFAPAGLPDLARRLPELRAATAATGATTGEVPGLPAGIPVFGGSIDLAMCSLGDNLTNGRSLHVTAGTWSINQQLRAKPTPEPDCLQIMSAPLDTGWLLVESSPTSAINLGLLEQWLGGARPDYAAWETVLATASLTADDPLYLPYPAGSWDLPGQRASLRDIRVGLSQHQLIAVVHEGIALGHVRQIRKFQRHQPLEQMILCGGLSRNAAWCQLLSDYAGLPVAVSANAHSSLWGVAACVRRGLGRPTLATRSDYQTYQPNPGRDGRERWTRFCEFLKEN